MAGLLLRFEGGDARALILNVGAALALVGLVHAAIFALAGDAATSSRGGRLLGPIPGVLIGLVWTVLFVVLAVVRWRLQRLRHEEAARRASRWVVCLLLGCAAYPLYTAGLGLPLVGLFGNAATIAVAGWVVVLVGRVSPIAALGPFAVVAWVAFASATIVDQARWVW